MSPDEHDRTLAATSHAPHLIAAALALATDENDLPLTAAGWLDTTRIAAADAELWRPIFAANRTNDLMALDGFEKTLSSLRMAIEAGDVTQLLELLREARARREAAASSGGGAS
jgi:prephenate dehydrogenase